MTLEGSITIRPEVPTDHPSIAEVVAAAFGSEVEADLVARIRASDRYVPELSLDAELDGRIVGHVMISGADLVHEIGDETCGRRIMMLSPLAVAPEFQRRGVGGALVRDASARADAAGEPLVVLEGNPAYYSRFGFEHSVPRGIYMTLPDWAPAEAAQVVLLASYDPDDPTLRGRVVYPPAFDGLD